MKKNINRVSRRITGLAAILLSMSMGMTVCAEEALDDPVVDESVIEVTQDDISTDGTDTDAATSDTSINTTDITSTDSDITASDEVPFDELTGADSNLTYSYDDATATLTITGSGEAGCPTEYTSKVKKVVISSSEITAIANSGFKNCKLLESITFTDSITKIGGYAFYECTALASVTMSDSVETIGAYAFHECSSLESIELSNSLKTIGAAAFAYCTKITSVVLPDSVTTLGRQVFYGCPVTEITIPLSTTSIGEKLVSSSSYSTLTIYGYKNSYAETYASSYGISFSSLGTALKVTYNANGGSVETNTKYVVSGSTYGELATPTHAQFTFLGWYTAKLNGTKITSSSTVSGTSGITLYAHWSSVPGVETRSQQQIADYINNSGISLTGLKNYGTTYSVSPSTTAPYALGTISDSSISESLKMLNIYRYVAGLNYDINTDSTYNEKAQAAALVSAINGKLSHYPTQPSNMSDSMYETAYSGASSSNIGSGHTNYQYFLAGCMRDNGSTTNIETVGHRRWILNPRMGKTGIGRVNNYYAMYAFDRSNTDGANTYIVPWPAQNTPVELMNLTSLTDYAWSVSVGSYINPNNTTLTMTRASDGKTWTFSTTGSNFYINNSSYGQTGCIIFYPGLSDSDYAAGNKYTISVKSEAVTFNYSVNFFSISNPGKETVLFSDVEKGKWYTEAVVYAYNNGIAQGYKGTDTFGTNDSVTRGQFAAMLYRIEGSPDMSYNAYFSDVAKGKYYTAAIEWCKEKGIVTGYQNSSKFGPDDTIKRQELATMLYRYAQYKGKDVSGQSDISSYSDVSTVSSYATVPFKWCVNAGIVNGKNGALDPLGNTTRAECVTMLYRYLN